MNVGTLEVDFVDKWF